MRLLTQSKDNVSVLRLMRQLGVSCRMACLVKHKMKEAMRVRGGGRELNGRVDVDDAYLDGDLSGDTSGRGLENKRPFVAAGQTTPACQPVLACLRPRRFQPRRLATMCFSIAFARSRSNSESQRTPKM